MAVSAKDVKALRDQTGAGMMDCKKALAEAEGDTVRAIEILRERGLAKAGKREGRATSEGAIAMALEGECGGMIELGCETDFVARTDVFIELAGALADAVAGDASLTSTQALLDATVGNEKASDRLSAAIATLGENVVLKRVARLAAPGGTVGGYVHAGGKLGVIVALAPAEGEGDAKTLTKDLAMHIAAADPTPIAVTRDEVSPDLLEAERRVYRAQAEQEGKPEQVIDRIVDGKLNKFLANICLLEQAFVKDPDRSVGDLLGGSKVAAFERFKLGEADAS
jgi:elongation factor Ts